LSNFTLPHGGLPQTDAIDTNDLQISGVEIKVSQNTVPLKQNPGGFLPVLLQDMKPASE
jgi:hypothetical protein